MNEVKIKALGNVTEEIPMDKLRNSLIREQGVASERKHSDKDKVCLSSSDVKKG